MGTSDHFRSQEISPLVHVRIISADLVPVFSFGENDVRILAPAETYLE